MPSPVGRARRRAGLLLTTVAVAAGMATTSGTHAASGAAPATDPYAPALTPATFADPPDRRPPEVPLVVAGRVPGRPGDPGRAQDIATHGGGGVEIAYFTPPSGGSNPNLQTYGWGEKEFAEEVQRLAAGREGQRPRAGLDDRRPLAHGRPEPVELQPGRSAEEADLRQRVRRRGREPLRRADSDDRLAPPTVTTTLCQPVAPGDTRSRWPTSPTCARAIRSAWARRVARAVHDHRRRAASATARRSRRQRRPERPTSRSRPSRTSASASRSGSG